jgi:hypothetical protein
MSLEEAYVCTFNEILEGKFTIVEFSDNTVPLVLNIKDREKNTLVETRNTLLYEWCKDNNELDLIEDLFDYVFVSETDPDLKGCDFKEISFIVSPETRRVLGIDPPKRAKPKNPPKPKKKPKPQKKKQKETPKSLEESLLEIENEFKDF